MKWMIVVVALLLHPAWAQEEAAEEQAESHAYFEKAHDALSRALDLFEGQADLPTKDELGMFDLWSSTQESQQRKIDVYLDAASGALGVSDMGERRQRIADLREKIRGLRRGIAANERRKVSAPDASFNPLVLTKKKLEGRIEKGRGELDLAQQQIREEKELLVAELNELGMELDLASVDMLLESPAGDEFVRVSIIFDNARRMAVELEQLTAKTDEDLEAARRYYGVYLMLLQTVERLQETFVQQVEEEYVPGVQAFAERARMNILDAKNAIEQGGDARVLRQNIGSNETLLDAAMLYQQELEAQKQQMLSALEECRKSILTAANTYRTAELSQDVLSMMAVSRQAFDSIAHLSVPDMRPFANKRMEEAFRSMLRDMESN